jgi:hypothetical protein
MEIRLTPIRKSNDEIEIEAIERTESGDKVLTDAEFGNLLIDRKGYFDSQISYNELENKIKIVVLNF